MSSTNAKYRSNVMLRFRAMARVRVWNSIRARPMVQLVLCLVLIVRVSAGIELGLVLGLC